VQDLPGAADDGEATSDGIAVFLGREAPMVSPGDEVLVTGQVTEFFGLTEIEDGARIELLQEGNPLPPAVTLAPPDAAEDALAYYEALEGMRVALPEARVIAPTFSGCGFFTVPAASGIDRVVRQSLEDSLADIIPVLHHSDVDCAGFPDVKTGDAVFGLSGPLTYHFDQYKIVQQDPAALTVRAEALRSPAPPAALAPGEFSVASFNVENYFDTVDDTGSSAEPKPTAAALAAKQGKLVQVIHEALGCPTLLGIEEVENATIPSFRGRRCRWTWPWTASPIPSSSTTLSRSSGARSRPRRGARLRPLT
jgi:predicted extracellular nuclease